MNQSICSFDGCDRLTKAKGLCVSHYQQRLRGRPLTPIREGYYTRDSSWSSLREKIEHYLEEQPDGCWIWTRVRTPAGYGHVRWGGKMLSVHRAYLSELGYLLPDGLVIDHLCRNRACANPNHLEIVTNRENILRGVGRAARNAVKTHCKYGHEFTPGNTYVYAKTGARMCRECMKLRQRVSWVSDEKYRRHA